MTRYLLLHSLFDSDWLIRPNFDNCYRKLQIVLEHEQILNMIMDLASEVLTSNTYHVIKDTYQKWPHDSITVWYFFFESSKEHEFSCKFDDAQWKKNLSNVEGVLLHLWRYVFSRAIIFWERKGKKGAKESCLGWGAQTDKRV